MTMSSILRIIRTHSVARVSALEETRLGWITLSAIMSEISFLRTLSPAFFSPYAWRWRSSVTNLIGSRPVFSASVYGTTSSASAKAFTQRESTPKIERAYS